MLLQRSKCTAATSLPPDLWLKYSEVSQSRWQFLVLKRRGRKEWEKIRLTMSLSVPGLGVR
jgi:hypothetical protein